MEKVKNPTWVAVVLLLILAGIGIRIPLLLTRVFDADEFQHLHSTYCIAHGMVPFIDYFQHHMPWLHYGLLPAYILCGDAIETLFAARAVMLVCTVFTLWLTCVLGRTASR